MISAIDILPLLSAYIYTFDTYENECHFSFWCQSRTVIFTYLLIQHQLNYKSKNQSRLHVLLKVILQK